MKKIISLLVFLFVGFAAVAQEAKQVAVFVYGRDNVTTPTSALRAKLTNDLLVGGDGRFVVVDRTEEILSALIREYKYQAGGMVRDTDLVSIGDHLGAHYLCVVDITYYPEDKQYFFECKLVNVESRQVERQSFYPTGQTVVSSLSPQEQIKVAGELSSVFRLKPMAFKVGDPYRDGSGNPVYVDGSLMRIGYIDETGEHGFSFVVLPIKYKHPYTAKSDSLFLRPPYLSEMRLLYGNNDVLGLSGEFWSLDEFGQVDKSPDWWFGSFDFDTGRQSRRKSDRRTKLMKDGRVSYEVSSVVRQKMDSYGRVVNSTKVPSEAAPLSCISIHPF